jgi:hypothetical protein
MASKAIQENSKIDDVTIIDFKNRKVSNQNFSKVMTLPKTALDSCGITSEVSVKLMAGKDGRYIKLSPVIEEEVK